MKITVKSTGTPPTSGAEAFARLLVAAMAKRAELKVVGPAKLAKHDDLHKFANR